jgi:hypothetical protein
MRGRRAVQRWGGVMSSSRAPAVPNGVQRGRWGVERRSSGCAAGIGAHDRAAARGRSTGRITALPPKSSRSYLLPAASPRDRPASIIALVFGCAHSCVLAVRMMMKLLTRRPRLSRETSSAPDIFETTRKALPARKAYCLCLRARRASIEPTPCLTKWGTVRAARDPLLVC